HRRGAVVAPETGPQVVDTKVDGAHATEHLLGLVVGQLVALEQGAEGGEPADDVEAARDDPSVQVAADVIAHHLGLFLEPEGGIAVAVELELEAEFAVERDLLGEDARDFLRGERTPRGGCHGNSRCSGEGTRPNVRWMAPGAGRGRIVTGPPPRWNRAAQGLGRGKFYRTTGGRPRCCLQFARVGR